MQKEKLRCGGKVERTGTSYDSVKRGKNRKPEGKLMTKEIV
jgi:hypothetical protein